MDSTGQLRLKEILCGAAIGIDHESAVGNYTADMEHGSREGTSTGTFIDWIKSICR